MSMTIQMCYKMETEEIVIVVNGKKNIDLTLIVISNYIKKLYINFTISKKCRNIIEWVAKFW